MPTRKASNKKLKTFLIMLYNMIIVVMFPSATKKKVYMTKSVHLSNYTLSNDLITLNNTNKKAIEGILHMNDTSPKSVKLFEHLNNFTLHFRYSNSNNRLYPESLTIGNSTNISNMTPHLLKIYINDVETTDFDIVDNDNINYRLNYTDGIDIKIYVYDSNSYDYMYYMVAFNLLDWLN